MTISRKAKIGFGIAAVGVTGLFVGVLSAASAKPLSKRPTPVDDDDVLDDDDDDDDAPLPPPSSVEIPAGTMPPTFPIGSGSDLDDVLAPDGPVFSNLPVDIPRPRPSPVDRPPPTVVVTPPQAPSLPSLPGILPPISPPVGVPQQPPPRPAPRPSPVPAPAPKLDPSTQAAAAMVLELLAAQKQKGWKRKYDSVREWQSLAGRPKIDGMFGPGDAIVIAQSFGDVPVVRYWPAESGANPKKALADYRGALEMMAKSKGGTHGEELRRSAQREKGQSFGPPVGTGGKGVVL
jgi:hypothetical protein